MWKFLKKNWTPVIVLTLQELALYEVTITLKIRTDNWFLFQNQIKIY